MDAPRTLQSSGALAATVVSIAPAHAATQSGAPGRPTRTGGAPCLRDHRVPTTLRLDGVISGCTWQDGSSADLRRRCKPDRTLDRASRGEISNAASYDGLKADDLFFVEVIERFDEGAGIVKTSAEPFLVSAQAPCTQ